MNNPMPMLAQVPTEVLGLLAWTVVEQRKGGVNLPGPEERFSLLQPLE